MHPSYTQRAAFGMIFLSFTLNTDTPSYGNRNTFKIEKQHSIAKGDTANDSMITTTVHIGTHLDMPYHFYENGQTIISFDANFFHFSKVLFLELTPKNYVIKDELINQLEKIEDLGYDILIVKTGSCYHREDHKYWSENYGFHPDVYDILIAHFPKIRLFGFDTISVSSFQERTMGKEAHKRFLNPDNPIVLLEDMDLRTISHQTPIESVVVAPLRIEKCDGIPCTVMAKLA